MSLFHCNNSPISRLRVGLIQALDHMSKFTVCALLLLAVCSVSARERPIFSCDEAPLLVEYKKQLPAHILAASADAKPEPQSKPPRIAVPILERARSNLVCVVIALDATGKAEDLAVSYRPVLNSRTRKESKFSRFNGRQPNLAGECAHH